MDVYDAPTNGLAANVRLTKESIEANNKEISQLQLDLDRIQLDQKAEQATIDARMDAMRVELQRHIEDLNNEQKTQHHNLNVLYLARKAPIEAKMQALQKAIDIAAGAIAPIRKIPAEILGYIFQEFIALDESPWLLTTVSKSWRQTALTTPVLWVHLYVNQAGNRYFMQRSRPTSWQVDGEYVLSYGKWLVCRTVDELHARARKSGVVPLDIDFRFSVSPDVDDTLKCLLIELSSRIGSLSISSTVYGQMPDLELTQLSSLRTLRFKASNFGTRSFVGSILSQAPRLESLASNIWLEFHVKHQCWGSLRVLHLGDRAFASQLNKVVNGMHRLEVLDPSPSHWPDTSTPDATLGHIKSISLECQPEFLGRIRLPALQTLNWIAERGDESEEVNDSYHRPWDFLFPSLTNLNVRAHDVGWLSRMSAPKLQTLSWSKNVLSPGPCPPFPQIQLLALQNLTCDAICDDDVFISALECAPNVTDVILAPGSSLTCPADWCMAVLERLANVDDILCPELSRLTLGRGDHQAGTKKTTSKPLIKRLVQSRKRALVPLQHFEIAWKKRSGKQQTTQHA